MEPRSDMARLRIVIDLIGGWRVSFGVTYFVFPVFSGAWNVKKEENEIL